MRDSTAIQGVFGGGGLIPTAMTGIVRIPAICANFTAALMVAELALRALVELVRICGFKPDSEGYIAKTAKQFNEWGIRPFPPKETKVEKNEGNEKKTEEGYISADTISLAKKAVILALLSNFSTEFVRIIGGNIPPIYNKVLSFLGPVRLSDRSLIDSIAAFFKR